MSISFKKLREPLLYILFGVLTTAVSLLACFLTLRIGVIFLHDEAGEPMALLDVFGSTVQWVSGVVVAFATNKLWVFTDAARGRSATAKQFLSFTGSRAATYVLEVIINLAAIAALDRLGYKPFEIFGIVISVRVWAKLISSVLVVISNYFISKLLVFRKRK